jgi:hypothetical protein
MLLIALLVFIILLAGIVFIGLMLIVSFGGGGEEEMGPLLQFAQWGGELVAGLLIYIAELLDQLLQTIEAFLQGI